MYHPIDSAFPFINDLAIFKTAVGEKPYQEEGLTLLHVRNNDLGTYWTAGHLAFIAAHHKIPVVEPSAGNRRPSRSCSRNC